MCIRDSYWDWNVNTSMAQAQTEITHLLSTDSGWTSEDRVGLIRVYGLFLNDKYMFRTTVSFFFKETGGIFTDANVQVLLSNNPTDVVVMFLTGLISFLWLIWQMISLRMLFIKKFWHWLDLFSCLVFLLTLGTYFEIDDNVRLLNIGAFSNWEFSHFRFSIFGDPSLQFEDNPNLSRIAVANYLGSMMWVWRSGLGTLLFVAYMKFVDRMSPLFPLITYPMDVIAAGGTSTFVFCITISMIVIGFVQMFVAQYYLYVEEVNAFLPSLQFLFMNLVGNTDTNIFKIPHVPIAQTEGTMMLAVFLFIMIYIFFTMFVAIIATNYRTVYRQIEETPLIDGEPLKARLRLLFCEYPKLLKALGPINFCRYLCSSRSDEDEEDATAPEDGSSGEVQEDDSGGALQITAVEELSDVEIARRELEIKFFGKFENLHERMHILMTHFEAVMGRVELLEKLQNTVNEIADRQSDLDGALSIHYHQVKKQLHARELDGCDPTSPMMSPLGMKKDNSYTLTH
eukprot:TRINITY_DN10690_c0_g1_i3.p1 TRINITY_DN10690_c0_g1~~TRINITY_DN10690_c0_g1_i3.p1  ORF type:complete len:512 (+),score=84.55 TRINITY_DN10690_c0_g1_i3:141-1676(+)